MKFKIATWNLDEASTTNKTRAGCQIEKLANIDADILILTETSQEIDLAKYGYNCIQNLEKNEYGKFYSVIWSKYEIVKRISTYDEATAVCCKIVLPNRNDIIIYGTIITYLSDKGSEGISKYGEEHYKEILRQGEDWSNIIKKYSPKLFCLAGDFNQPRDGSSWYSAKAANKRGIEALTGELNKNNLTCLTDKDFFKSGELQDRHSVDHICLTKNTYQMHHVGVWQGSYGIANKKLSDHNGVFVEISM